MVSEVCNAQFQDSEVSKSHGYVGLGPGAPFLRRGHCVQAFVPLFFGRVLQ